MRSSRMRSSRMRSSRMMTRATSRPSTILESAVGCHASKDNA